MPLAESSGLGSSIRRPIRRARRFSTSYPSGSETSTIRSLILGVLGAGARALSDRRPTSPAAPRAGPTLPAAKRPSPSPGLRGRCCATGIPAARCGFAFSNGNPLFGSPTSTLDWQRLTGHSGEVFARLDHKPTGVFVKGVFGLGIDARGLHRRPRLLCRPVPVLRHHQRRQGRQHRRLRRSTSAGPIRRHRTFASGLLSAITIGARRSTAYGLRCNPTDIVPPLCAGPVSVPVGFDTAVRRLRADLACGADRLREPVRDQRSLVGQCRARRHPVCGAAEQGQPSAAAEPGRPRAGAERHHRRHLRIRRRGRGVRQLRGDPEYRGRRRACATWGLDVAGSGNVHFGPELRRTATR